MEEKTTDEPGTDWQNIMIRLEEVLTANPSTMHDTEQALEYINPEHLTMYFNNSVYRLRPDIKDIPKGIDDEVDKDGNTMLHLAVLRNDESMVSCMLIKKADPNKWNHLGNTPVHLAVLHGRIEILRKLVAFGGNLNMVGNEALLPVEMIPLSADKTCMEAILALGPNMKSKNYKGDTFLLHYLKKYPDRINDIRRLLDNGCDPKATDRAGRNGLFIVTALRSNRQKVELARMLLDYGERADAPMLHRIVMELTPEDIGQENEDLLGIFYHNKNRMTRRSPYDTLSCSNMVNQYADRVMKGATLEILELYYNILGIDDLDLVHDECQAEISLLQHTKIKDYPLTFYEYLYCSLSENCKLVNQKAFRDEVIRCSDYFSIYSDMVLDKLNIGLRFRNAKRDCARFLQSLLHLPYEVCVMIIDNMSNKEALILCRRLKLEH